MSKPIMLTASAGKTFDLQATLGTVTASEGKRTVSGEIVRYGALGNTSYGATIFEPGSIQVDAELSRVKMLEMHDHERSIGYLLDYSDSAERMTGSWYIADTDAGNSALQAAQNKTRDALSLGVQVLEYAFSDNDELIVKAAKLLEVSLVTIPAFSGSRVESVAANRKEIQAMPQPKTPAAPEVEATNTPEPIPAAPAQVEATNTPAQIHAGAGNEPMSLVTLSAKIKDSVTAGNTSAVLGKINPSLTAALTDIVPSDDGGLVSNATRPAWFGELWNARRVDRPTVESVQRESLTALKGYGYRKVYPAPTDTPAHLVNKYAGNKQAIPASAKIKTKPAEYTAKRWAGGWDVDRAYFDFADNGFVQMTLQAAYDDYLQQTEADLVAAMVAAGVATAGADVLELLASVGSDAASLGSAISKIQFAPDLWAQFVTLNSAEVPWWLRNQGSINLGTTEGNAGNLAFNVNPELGAGQMLAHDRRAVTFRETPIINVQAQNIPNGGIDLGVFGYTAHTINDARAIFVGGVTEPPAG